MKKILVMTSTYPRWRGDATPSFVAQFADQLAEQSWGVTVLAPHAAGAKTKEKRGEVAVCRFRYSWPASSETLAYDGGAVAKIKKTPGYALKLLMFMASLFVHTFLLSVGKRVQVINAHWIIPQGFVAVLVKAVTGMKVVVSVHGGDIFSLNGKWMRRVKAFTLRHADAVVVNSSATLKACQELCGRSDIKVVPMGVDLERFKPQQSSAELRKRYGLGCFTVLFVGRLSEEKGVIYLLEALKQLQEVKADFKALIVGDGPEKARLERFVAENGLSNSAVFAGWVDASDVQEYYSVADVFVGPSIISKRGWKEALGLVFVESLACGVPVVATATGGIADVVDDGATGYLVPEKSADAIFEKLRELYDNPQKLKVLSANAREQMQDRFSWRSVILRYLDVLDPAGGQQ